jgi:hypothetical protein
VDEEVLIGEYECRADSGTSVNVTAVFGDVTIARCELLASELENQLHETACTVGNRDGHSVSGVSFGFTFACQGPRARLVDVIGEMGRSVLGATL